MLADDQIEDGSYQAEVRAGYATLLTSESCREVIGTIKSCWQELVTLLQQVEGASESEIKMVSSKLDTLEKTIDISGDALREVSNVKHFTQEPMIRKFQ